MSTRATRDVYVGERLNMVANIFKEIENHLTRYKKDDDISVGAAYGGKNGPLGILANEEDIAHNENWIKMVQQMHLDTVAIAKTGPTLHVSKRERNIIRGLIAAFIIVVLIFMGVILWEVRRLGHF